MRYYFHLHEADGTVVDEEGLELASLEAARREAIAGARCMIASDVLAGRLPLGSSLIVEDETGRPAFRMPFSEVVRLDG